jgi:S1-C subfamily serine protease
MNLHITTALILLIASATSSLAQKVLVPSPNVPMTMEKHGSPLEMKSSDVVSDPALRTLQIIGSDLPTAQLAKVTQERFTDAGVSTRSAKDAEIYRVISPSVVIILTKDGFGSGSLIGKSGEIITNYHVVKGYSDVAVVFKPALEGKEPTRDDVKLGHVAKYDEIADLALVKAVEVPSGRTFVHLGDASDIGVGADVHAIGHPTGEAWTYTTGVISQYRMGYEWTTENIKHKADIIQTQTPINPGNSGGPLISDSGTLIGINSFKVKGEALNFAISVDDVKKFLTRQGNRVAQNGNAAARSNSCELKELSRFRNSTDDSTVIEYDYKCNGKANADYIIPDDKTQPIRLLVDRNDDGQPDVIYYDLKQQRRWDISFWDENFEGRWTLVGYHPDGKLEPSSFESYEAFQKRQQASR